MEQSMAESSAFISGQLQHSCFICQTVITSSGPRLPKSDSKPSAQDQEEEESSIKLLCQLFKLDHFYVQLKALQDNVSTTGLKFCDKCRDEMDEIRKLRKLIESLQQQSADRTNKLKSTLISTAQGSNEQNIKVKLSGNDAEDHENTLKMWRKFFTQCLSYCHVVVSPLQVDQLRRYVQCSTDRFRSRGQAGPKSKRMPRNPPRKHRQSAENKSRTTAPLTLPTEPQDSDVEFLEDAPNSKSLPSPVQLSDAESESSCSIFSILSSNSDLDQPPKTKKSSRSSKSLSSKSYNILCGRCPSTFRSQKLRRKHWLQDHNIDMDLFCRYCDAELRSCLTLTDPSNPSQTIYKCTLDRCQGCTFETLEDFRRHHHRRCMSNPSVIKELEKDRVCPTCKETFKSNYLLRNHVATVHEKTYRFCCELCGRGCQQSSALRIHMKRVHGEACFSCEICGKGFKYKERFVVHMRGHKEERPFVCDACGKGFTSKQNLTRHQANMHSDDQVPCPVCGKVFKSITYVANHMNNFHKGGYSLKRNLVTNDEAECLEPSVHHPSESVIHVQQA